MQWVEIPDFQQRGFQLSSIFLGEHTPDDGAVAAGPEDVPQSVNLSVARRFARTSSIRFLAYVYNAAAVAAAPPDVALQVQIFRDNPPVFTAPLRKLQTAGPTDPSRL